MSYKESTGNPWKSEIFEPLEKEGESLVNDDPFLEDEIEEEVNRIDDMEEAMKNPRNTEKQLMPEESEEIVQLKTELKECRDKLLRAHADMENVRQRSRRDIENAHKYALDNFSRDLLPIVDSLEKALDHTEDHEHMKVHTEGIELTLKMFLEVLNRHGIKQLNPVGEPFDPSKHEAISVQKNIEVNANTVLAVLQKGYELNGRLIRPALVIVSQT